MSSNSKRLAEGGRIDRGRPLEFSFDGSKLTGFQGDTLASALLANGVSLVGRSFKYHRPRGIFSAGAEEPNALVTLGTGGRREPNLPATMLELADGMVAESQNRWPSLAFDVQSLNSLFAPFLSAGFYYKTFMGPTRRAWIFYEHFIRKAAGLGKAAMEPDPDHYEVRHAFADVAIVGGGPAGLSAARAAASAGARVALIEQDFRFGGQLLSERPGSEAAAWLQAVEAELEGFGNVGLMERTTAVGLYDGKVLGLVERRDDAQAAGQARQVFTILRAGAIVFASGAIERPLVFSNNDRPGVMLASAVRTYVNRFAILPGRKAIVATTNDGAWRTAFDLVAAGAQVTVADLRAALAPALQAEASRLGIAVRAGTRIADLRGGRAVKAARLAGAGAETEIDCDLVCVSGGWSPTVHLTSQLGVKPVYREDIDGFVPGPFAPGQFGVGSAVGGCSTAEAIETGHRAGIEAASYCGKTRPVPAALRFQPAEPAATAFRSLLPARGKAFVDFQMDVTTGDIALAHREGYESVEHLKRYTTLGMGTDQGKTSNFPALSAMAALRGATIPETGTTTFRPPYTPVAIGALAGRAVGHHFKPIRRTPMHDWHVANGADMLEVGLWMRPYFYRGAGRDVNEAYVAEMRFVREAAGLMDISTLGKIDIQGPDAATLLDRVYANGFAKLPVGRARYGVMLRDDGIVFDDGTTTRLGEQRFFMTTSTAKAADVMSRLEFLLDTAWPDLRVAVTFVTDEWAVMSVAGPRSRQVLAATFPALDLSDEALPHMGFIEGEFDGRALRIIRLSYSGERAYEVYVGASAGEAAWQRLIEVGEPFGLRPYGVEALGALRVEKGHVAGPEIDGRTTLDDLGLGRMVGKRTGFVGDVLRRRPAFGEPNRQRLVGLKCAEAGTRLSGGAILFKQGETRQGHGRGRITSVTYSPTLGAYVGLALLAGDVAIGEEVVAVHRMKNEAVRAHVVSPVFLDPEGERLHG
ncbi:sarcosine oxidase subunit alpha family protein [Mesorhizobium sp.]|uniref:sarcosine oxidase subunit alpha family protein n=1 Tax=Mesorhizobium sp. TaxID=1871066 RepID=UPI000FE524A5|nr:sarcosine oxidase subunit alpha family protein [Mesorhizobium sp.]RWM30604.1 MAG: sarcosine oxidase subunit alpha family protein [Mesorhizobium sp.]TIO72917.1 MAG: sarcosine oxidase subunit alpha family protein [Mesorhizobium sp.]TIO80890.1 MAG: sarcosine oxidase subunit alpha family protein [Mesorhizobium sp.]TJV51415.1 MAG: sarcosine oxidase subunit alpha family protein [Mesorhizobium sp.]